MTDPVMRILVSPSPPKAGESVTICYDFPDEPPPTSITLDVEWEPPSGSASYIVTRAMPCITLTVPLDALSLSVDDIYWTSPSYVCEVISP